MTSDCILWTKALNSGGYPVTWKNGKTVYAHREIVNATKDQVVLHTCDNPACVNPAHLRLGTDADNSADMVAKNRQAKGSDCGNAKLDEETVTQIRFLKSHMSSRQVADRFNISKTNVLDIWNNKIWRHV